MLQVEKHPDKTFIGKTEKGFDFLGYFLKPGEIGVAERTLENCREHISRLYEQGVGESGIVEYVHRWLKWFRSGLGQIGTGMMKKGAKTIAVQPLEVFGGVGKLLFLSLPDLSPDQSCESGAY